MRRSKLNLCMMVYGQLAVARASVFVLLNDGLADFAQWFDSFIQLCFVIYMFDQSPPEIERIMLVKVGSQSGHFP